jgi:hypothetical protein
MTTEEQQQIARFAGDDTRGARVDAGSLLPLTFAPVHKSAFGVAIGAAAGLTLALFTLIGVVRRAPADTPLVLLDEYFAGYTVSLVGALVGFLWGFATGFIAGWFIALSRNFVLAASIFWIRARADLSANRDFLDHI